MFARALLILVLIFPSLSVWTPNALAFCLAPTTGMMNASCAVSSLGNACLAMLMHTSPDTMPDLCGCDERGVIPQAPIPATVRTADFLVLAPAILPSEELTSSISLATRRNARPSLTLVAGRITPSNAVRHALLGVWRT